MDMHPTETLSDRSAKRALSTRGNVEALPRLHHSRISSSSPDCVRGSRKPREIHLWQPVVSTFAVLKRGSLKEHLPWLRSALRISSFPSSWVGSQRSRRTPWRHLLGALSTTREVWCSPGYHISCRQTGNSARRGKLSWEFFLINPQAER